MTIVRQRRCIGESQRCKQHAKEILEDLNLISATHPPGQYDVAAIVFRCGTEFHNVVLTSLDGKHHLTIQVGMIEISSILAALSHQPPPRPLTFDLVRTIIVALDGNVRSVAIANRPRPNERFLRASIRVGRRSTTMRVDARPSDAISVALSTTSPIYIVGSDELASGDSLTTDPSDFPVFEGRQFFRNRLSFAGFLTWLLALFAAPGAILYLALGMREQPVSLGLSCMPLIVLTCIATVQVHAWLTNSETPLRLLPEGIQYGREHWRWCELSALRLGINSRSGTLRVIVQRNKRGPVRFLDVDRSLSADEISSLASGIQSYLELIQSRTTVIVDL